MPNINRSTRQPGLIRDGNEVTHHLLAQQVNNLPYAAADGRIRTKKLRSKYTVNTHHPPGTVVESEDSVCVVIRRGRSHRGT